MSQRIPSDSGLESNSGLESHVHIFRLTPSGCDRNFCLFVLLWLLSVKACGEKTIALFEKTMALYFKNVSFLPTFLKVNHYSDIMWIGGSCVVEPLLSPFQWCQISGYLGGTHFLSIRTRPRSTHWEQQTFSIVGIFLMSSSCGKLDVKMFPHCSS